MGLKTKRKILTVGRYSRAITIPAGLEVGEESSIAANRIMIIDPRGKIDPEDLLEFLETHVEPIFWRWLEEKRMKSARKKEGLDNV